MAFPFEMRLTLSKRFPPGTSEVVLGRYTLRPVPTSFGPWADTVLSFQNTYEDPVGGGSHPEEEALNCAHLLSLLFDSRLRRGPIRVDTIEVPEARPFEEYPQFLGPLDPSSAEEDLTSILSLPYPLGRQFLRAAKTYSMALGLIPQDITFAFFLLVVAIECLASQNAVIPFSELLPDGNTCERFCRFISTNLPSSEREPDEDTSDLFLGLLKTVYYSHRSGFAHGGREVSSASLLADRAKSSYFTHEVDGKEVRTPGVGWFARIVRGSLLGFVRDPALRQGAPRPDLLSELAFEKAGLRMKARRPLEQGTAVTLDDIEYR